jgi:hypothetical protein
MVQVALEEQAEIRVARERALACTTDVDERSAALAIRTEALGSDRHHRRYHMLCHCNDLIWVESSDGGQVGVLHKPEQLRAVMERLLARGPREKELAHVLEHRKSALFAGLRENGHPQVQTGFRLQDMVLDLPPTKDAPDEVTAGAAFEAPEMGAGPDTASAMGQARPMTEEQAEAAAVAAGVGYLCTLFDSLIFTNTSVTACEQLKEKLASVHSLANLFAVRPLFVRLVQHVCAFASGRKSWQGQRVFE